MQQIFFDKNQAVVIKVFPNSSQLEREVCGAKSLAKAAVVPKIEKLDNRVAKIELLPGFLGYQIGSEELNLMVAEFLLSTRPVKKAGLFSIFEEIRILKRVFIGDKRAKKELEMIESAILGVPLYPVHGDLQKQNIVIANGKLGLVDFEHFTFAPKELELCNSLFFNDGNCLDVAGIIRFLPPQTLDRKMLVLTARFYALRQVCLGMDKVEARHGLAKALHKIAGLPLDKKQLLAGDNEGSFCYI